MNDKVDLKFNHYSRAFYFKPPIFVIAEGKTPRRISTIKILSHFSRTTENFIIMCNILA